MANKSVYLVAYYMVKPKHSRVKTQNQGWMNNADNVSYEEQITVATRLKTKDLSMAKVILDLGNRSIYRNSWNNGKTFDELFGHYYSGYQRYLDPVIHQLGYEMVKNEDIANTPVESLPEGETVTSQ